MLLIDAAASLRAPHLRQLRFEFAASPLRRTSPFLQDVVHFPPQIAAQIRPALRRQQQRRSRTHERTQHYTSKEIHETFHV
jgi:hypothetical protein